MTRMLCVCLYVCVHVYMQTHVYTHVEAKGQCQMSFSVAGKTSCLCHGVWESEKQMGVMKKMNLQRQLTQ